MKDRQFTVILALVVAAGLVMGLVAFRMTGAAHSTSAAVAAGTVPNAPKPSAADEQVADQSATDGPPPTGTAGSQDGEPSPIHAEPPPMEGPANGDPPATATVEPSQPAAPEAAPGDTLQ